MATALFIYLAGVAIWALSEGAYWGWLGEMPPDTNVPIRNALTWPVIFLNALGYAAAGTYHEHGRGNRD